ncbi:MAG: sulfate transporter [Candidatus Abyssobacteria bacterium SURF_5]|uniref:Sulfate transporter n=1 Tax=Abyssobacteria bacterium (strain SURF_5) TaxID=2093360 RepID=A0A3A4NFM2_ABYX5|nr:MAG: sulfate transporter [Candidatus Abyssubacteria bacterium SURF_5]
MKPAAETVEIPWTSRARLGKNRYDHIELAGAFGDLGTLIPFVVGYIAVMDIDPLGILFMFGISLIAAGLYYKTPIPVQPMKAIGGAAIASGGGISAGMICGAGLFTGIFWFLAGTTRFINVVTKLATKPIIRGIVLGLGLSFITEGVRMMRVTPWLAIVGLIVTYLLLTYPKVPAMFALLLLGIIGAFQLDQSLTDAIATLRPDFRWPEFTLARTTWKEMVAGTFILAIPQIPLTIGNAVIAIRAENNELFPDRPVTDRLMAVSQGVMNLVSAPFGGIPMCHGAGGMAGHVRFGARTGGSLVMLGCILLVLGLFFSQSIGLLFQAFPKAILGVILFFAGTELAITTRDIGNKKEDVYVMLVVAGIAMWNMGIAFLAGIILYQLLHRQWVRL